MSEAVEWDSSEWLSEARHLLKWAHQINPRTPMILVVRHSHREDYSDAQEQRMAELTPLGHRTALRFGERLPSGRDVRIFYSSYARCVQTARDIAEGYRTTGGSAELVSDIPVLVGPLGDPTEIAEQWIRLGGPAFMVKWSKGQLSHDMIEPMESFCDRFIADIIRPLAWAKSSELQLHVTHDLVIMAARLALFKTRPTKTNWTSFLGGFAAAMDERGIHVFENGKACTRPELASFLAAR